MLKEFKDFIMRGSVIDLAVGVVIGGAFTNIVNGLVTGLITPLINLIFVQLFNKDQSTFAKGMEYTVKGVSFDFGTVITAIITFLITAFVLFLIVKSVNKFKDMTSESDGSEDETPAPTTDDYLKEIRDLLAKDEANK